MNSEEKWFAEPEGTCGLNFKSGGGDFWCADPDAWSNGSWSNSYQNCVKNAYNAIKNNNSFSEFEKAMLPKIQCCNNMQQIYWCYANEKDEDYNPCGTSGAIWINNAIPFGHGGCCIFTE